jgi:hypothetical protein
MLHTPNNSWANNFLLRNLLYSVQAARCTIPLCKIRRQILLLWGLLIFALVGSPYFENVCTVSCPQVQWAAEGDDPGKAEPRLWAAYILHRWGQHNPTAQSLRKINISHVKALWTLIQNSHSFIRRPRIEGKILPTDLNSYKERYYAIVTDRDLPTK